MNYCHSSHEQSQHHHFCIQRHSADIRIFRTSTYAAAKAVTVRLTVVYSSFKQFKPFSIHKMEVVCGTRTVTGLWFLLNTKQ